MRTLILKSLLSLNDESDKEWHHQSDLNPLVGAVSSSVYVSARNILISEGLVLFERSRNRSSRIALSEAGVAAARALTNDDPKPKINPRFHRNELNRRPPVQSKKAAPASRKCLFCGGTFSPEHSGQYIHSYCKRSPVFEGDQRWI